MDWKDQQTLENDPACEKLARKLAEKCEEYEALAEYIDREKLSEKLANTCKECETLDEYPDSENLVEKVAEKCKECGVLNEDPDCEKLAGKSEVCETLKADHGIHGSEKLAEKCEEWDSDSSSPRYKTSVPCSPEGGSAEGNDSDDAVCARLKSARMRSRRNALCDPFRLPIPQTKREELERDRDKRKTSVTRKVSNFLTISLDLHREEDLL